MSAVDTALSEVNSALAALNPQIEGLNDYLRLNIKDETRAEVQSLLNEYLQRQSLLNSAKNSMQELVNDGYPNNQTRQISQAALADLDEQIATIGAARPLFTSNEATSLSFSIGIPRPKTS